MANGFIGKSFTPRYRRWIEAEKVLQQALTDKGQAAQFRNIARPWINPDKRVDRINAMVETLYTASGQVAPAPIARLSSPEDFAGLQKVVQAIADNNYDGGGGTPPVPIQISITSTHAERRVYPISSLSDLKAAGGNGGTASVRVAGTFVGSPSVIQARSVDYTTGAAVSAWATIVGSPANGAFVGSVNLPEYDGWQKIEFRGAGSGAALTATATRIGAGILVGIEGQSQARYFVTNVGSGAAAYTPDDLTSVYAQDGMLIAAAGEDWTAYPAVDWHWAGETYTKSGKTFLNGGGAGVAAAGKSIRSALKVPVAFISNAVGGVGMDVLNADPAKSSAQQRYTETGRPHYIATLGHGGNDLGLTEAAYTTRQETNRGWHTANAAYTPRNKFIVSLLARRQLGSNADVSAIRRSQVAFIAAHPTDTLFGSWSYDLSLQDDVHENAPGGDIWGRRLGSVIVNDVINTGAATGPMITTVTRNGVNIELTVAFVGGGSALEANDTTANPGTLTAGAFEVTRDSDGAVQTISSIAFSGNKVTLVLASDPGSAVSVKYGVSPSPGGKVLADNTRYTGLSRGAPIRPLLTAMSEVGGPLAISGSPGNRTVGNSTAFTPSVSGGTAPYNVTQPSGTLPPGRTFSNGSITGTYTTAGTYTYTLRVTDAANTSKDLEITQTIAAASSLKTAKVNIGANQATSDGWNYNNYGDRTTAGSLALRDTSGAPTGWTMTTTTAFSASQASGGFQPTPANSGIVPDDVLASYFTSSSGPGRLNVAGLDPAKKYRLTLVPSRNSTASRLTTFSINSGQQTLTVDADRNFDKAAIFENVPPDASGNILIGVLLGSGNTVGHYTNALIIEEMQS